MHRETEVMVCEFMATKRVCKLVLNALQRRRRRPQRVALRLLPRAARQPGEQASVRAAFAKTHCPTLIYSQTWHKRSD